MKGLDGAEEKKVQKKQTILDSCLIILSVCIDDALILYIRQFWKTAIVIFLRRKLLNRIVINDVGPTTNGAFNWGVSPVALKFLQCQCLF